MKTTFTRRQQLKLLTAAGLAAPFATRVFAAEADKNAGRAGAPENAAAPLSAGDRFLAGGKNVSVLDFGAVPDGKTLTTEALQKAIDQCAATGGGTVTVPPGVFLTHTVFLKSGVNLHLQKGAVILGDTTPEAFSGSGGLWRQD